MIALSDGVAPLHPSRNASSAAQLAEIRDEARCALGRLSPLDRRLVLCIGDGRSHSEAAQECDIPVKSASTRLRRVRQRLAKEISPMAEAKKRTEKVEGDRLPSVLK